jgi:O-antigen/teichoic acid export membrane protein
VVNLSNSFASMLQANTTVNELAAVNVIGKLAWGVLVVAGLLLGLPLAALGGAFVLAEGVRAVCLHALTRRHLDLKMRVDFPATFTVVLASLPYYANSLAIALGSRMDVTMLGFLTHDDHEVGYYGAASNLAGLAFLLSPLMSSVLLPLLSRAHARSPEDFWRILHRAAEGLIVMGTPVVLVLTLDAELWVSLAFGQAFEPAAHSLRALAPQFVVTYLAVLYSMALMVRNEGWALTSISAAGVILNPLIAAILVPQMWRLGPGGAGAGSGLALILGETFVGALLLRRLGRRAFDARLLRVAGGTLAAAGGATLVHELLPVLGALRVLPDLAAYAAIALGLGALRPRDLRMLASEIQAARRKGDA